MMMSTISVTAPPFSRLIAVLSFRILAFSFATPRASPAPPFG